MEVCLKISLNTKLSLSTCGQHADIREQKWNNNAILNSKFEVILETRSSSHSDRDKINNLSETLPLRQYLIPPYGIHLCTPVGTVINYLLEVYKTMIPHSIFCTLGSLWLHSFLCPIWPISQRELTGHECRINPARRVRSTSPVGWDCDPNTMPKSMSCQNRPCGQILDYRGKWMKQTHRDGRST